MSWAWQLPAALRSSNERTAATAAMLAGPTSLSLPVDGNAVVAVGEVVTVCDVDKALASDGGETKLPVEPAPVAPLLAEPAPVAVAIAVAPKDVEREAVNVSVKNETVGVKTAKRKKRFVLEENKLLEEELVTLKGSEAKWFLYKEVRFGSTAGGQVVWLRGEIIQETVRQTSGPEILPRDQFVAFACNQKGDGAILAQRVSGDGTIRLFICRIDEAVSSTAKGAVESSAGLPDYRRFSFSASKGDKVDRLETATVATGTQSSLVPPEAEARRLSKSLTAVDSLVKSSSEMAERISKVEKRVKVVENEVAGLKARAPDDDRKKKTAGKSGKRQVATSDSDGTSGFEAKVLKLEADSRSHREALATVRKETKLASQKADRAAGESADLRSTLEELQAAFQNLQEEHQELRGYYQEQRELQDRHVPMASQPLRQQFVPANRQSVQ